MIQLRSVTEWLERDEVARLIGVRYSTMAVWRHRGLVSPPSIPGGTGQQGRYGVDDTFTLAVFAQATRMHNMSLANASVLSRYFAARPGSLACILHYWPKPVPVNISPRYDLAGLALPAGLHKALTESAVRATMRRAEELLRLLPTREIHASSIGPQIGEEMPVESLFSSMAGSSEPSAEATRVLEAASDPDTRQPNIRGTVAAAIFRNQKRLQYGGTRPRFFAGHLDQLNLSTMGLVETLVAEAWAIQYLDDVLLQAGLHGPPSTAREDVQTFDLTPVVESVAEAFGDVPRPALKEGLGSHSGSDDTEQP